MFQVILIFSDWIWIKQMIVSSTLFVLRKTWETKAWVKIHRFNASTRNVKTIKLKNVSHTWWNIQIKNNSMGILERDKNPNQFIKIWKDVSLRLTLEDKDKGGYQFVGSNLGVEIFWKRGKIKKRLYWNRRLRLLCTLCIGISR